MEANINSIFRISIILLVAMLLVAASCQWLLSNKSFGLNSSEHDQEISQIELTTDIEELRRQALVHSKFSFSAGNLISSFLDLVRAVAFFLAIIVFSICVLSYKTKKDISNQALKSDAAEPPR